MELKSILIIQTAFIGDVILSTALAESLHLKFPGTPIDFMVRKGNELLLSEHPFIRTVLVFDKSRKYRNMMKLIGTIRSSKYDLVINVQRFATTGIITALSGARRTVGFRKNPMSVFFSNKFPHALDGRHEVERNHQLIESWVGKSDPRPRLYPSRKQFEKVAHLKGQSFITISPASVWFTKQFPAEQWIKFIHSLAVDQPVFLLGAPSDAGMCNEILQSNPGRRIKNLAGELSLLESAALMKDAAMNYVNDSAPMHLASAMNAPVTAVYCSTVPAFGFGPLSDISIIVESKETLLCRPCGLHGFRKCPQGHFKCATTISIESLKFKVER